VVSHTSYYLSCSCCCNKSIVLSCLDSSLLSFYSCQVRVPRDIGPALPLRLKHDKCRYLKVANQNRKMLLPVRSRSNHLFGHNFEINIFDLMTDYTVGGCGQMYEAIIVSPQFTKKTTLARHRLVNSALKDEIAAIHAWTPKCHTPEEWEKKKPQ
jgi:stress-induced morphogen